MRGMIEKGTKKGRSRTIGEKESVQTNEHTDIN
jgi:hypothetical protein